MHEKSGFVWMVWIGVQLSKRYICPHFYPAFWGFHGSKWFQTMKHGHEQRSHPSHPSISMNCWQDTWFSSNWNLSIHWDFPEGKRVNQQSCGNPWFPIRKSTFMVGFPHLFVCLQEFIHNFSGCPLNFFSHVYPILHSHETTPFYVLLYPTFYHGFWQWFAKFVNYERGKGFTLMLVKQ